MTKNNILYYLTYLFVITLFAYLFYLSTKYIINSWTFSQAHINYSNGFVKRGLFGTIALLLENNYKIKFVNTFNIFFIFFYLANIILFFLIIKQYSKFFYIFIFLALSPTLILFSFNDLGGYQRFDVISIFLILFHTYSIFLYRSGKINFKSYKNKFYFIIFPIFLASLFIHEIQFWSIPFHFFMIKNIYDENNIKNKNFYIFFLFLILASIIVFLYPVSQQTINSMIKGLGDRNIWDSALVVASSSEGNISIINYEIRTNLLNLYNLKINLFFLFMGVIPINILIYFLNNRKLINIKNNKIYLYYYLSVIPYLTFFAIGDTGRWLHIISIVSFSFLGQYPIDKTKQFINKSRFFLSKILVFIILIIYCFFVRLPHCCNLEEKKITIWGGLHKKFEAVYKIYFNNLKDEKFDLNKRFQKK
jgi:hypothetical protein